MAGFPHDSAVLGVSNSTLTGGLFAGFPVTKMEEGRFNHGASFEGACHAAWSGCCW